MKRIYIIAIGAVAIVALALGAIVLGVMVTPVRAQIARTINQAFNHQPILSLQAQGIQLKTEKGVLVAGVFQDSPADKAGIVRGDILLSVDGQDVNKVADLTGILAKHKAGDALQFAVQHGDSQKTVSVTLAEPPAQNSTQNNNAQPTNPMPKWFQGSGPYLGIVPVGAGEGLGRIERFEFGTNAAHPGAYITEVAAGSPAEKAGLKQGEVITSVDGTAIDKQNSLSSLLANHKPGDTVKLAVTAADGTSRDVSVTLGDNPQKQGSPYLGVATGGFGRFGQGGKNAPFHQFAPNLVGHPGAFIQTVTAGSPAEKAGLKQGNLIEAVDGKKIDGPQALSDIIASHKPGDTIAVTVYDAQASKSSDVQLTLGDNPQKAGTAWMGISYNYIDLQPKPANPNNNGTSGTQF